MLGLNVIFTKEGTVLSTEACTSRDTFDKIIKTIVSGWTDSSVGLK